MGPSHNCSRRDRKAYPSMLPAGRLTRYQVLTSATVALTLVLIAVGALVRTTGSGLGCPDWPLCHGNVIPPLEKTAIIEYSHRSLASIVGLLIVATSAATLLSRKQDRAARLLALAVVPLLGIQAYLGKVTVERELPPEIVTTHLATAFTLLSMLAMLAAFSFLGEHRVRLNSAERARYLSKVLIAMIAMAIVMLIGAYVVASGSTTACTTWPNCMQAPIPFVNGGSEQSIHWLHRLTVLVGLGVVAWLRFSVDSLREPADDVRFGANTLVGLFVLQMAVGALNIFSKFAPLALTLHLAVAAAVWLTLVLMFVVGRYAPETRQLPSRVIGIRGQPQLESRG